MTRRLLDADACPVHWIASGNQFTVKDLTIMASISVHDKIDEWAFVFFCAMPCHASFIDKLYSFLIHVKL